MVPSAEIISVGFGHMVFPQRSIWVLQWGRSARALRCGRAIGAREQSEAMDVSLMNGGCNTCWTTVVQSPNVQILYETALWLYDLANTRMLCTSAREMGGIIYTAGAGAPR